MGITINLKQPEAPNKIIKLIKGKFGVYRADEYYIKENDDKIYFKDNNEAVDRVMSGTIDPYLEMTEGEYIAAKARDIKRGIKKIRENTLCGAMRSK